MRYIKKLNEMHGVSKRVPRREKGTKFLEGAKKLQKEIEGILYILEDEGVVCRVDVREESYYIRSDGESSYRLLIIKETQSTGDDPPRGRVGPRLSETDHYIEFVDRCREICNEHGYSLYMYAASNFSRKIINSTTVSTDDYGKTIGVALLK